MGELSCGRFLTVVEMNISEVIAELKAISWRIKMQDLQVALPVSGGDDAI